MNCVCVRVCAHREGMTLFLREGSGDRVFYFQPLKPVVGNDTGCVKGSGAQTESAQRRLTLEPALETCTKYKRGKRLHESERERKRKRSTLPQAYL